MHSVFGPLSKILNCTLITSPPSFKNIPIKHNAWSYFLNRTFKTESSLISIKLLSTRALIQKDGLSQHWYATSPHSQTNISKDTNVQIKSTTAAFKKIKRKSPGSQKTKPHKKPGKDAWSVVGYSTAESYDLYNLSKQLAIQDLYDPVYLGHELAPLCLCATSKYNFDHMQIEKSSSNDQNTDSSYDTSDDPKLEPNNPGKSKDIFFFADGSVVFWSVPELERKSVLDFIRTKPNIEEADGIYDEDTIFEESEMMTYSYDQPDKKSSHIDKKGQISMVVIEERNGHYLERYAFSNAIAASVKLGAIEAQLDRIIDSIEFLSGDMKRGREVKISRSEVLRKTGEVYALRHVLNLSSDLLDTPDFYWDRANLEAMYHETCAHLAVGKRIRVTNEKINHCCELLDLVTNNLNDHHHTKLEWYIIILIMIEVFFELFHFIERFMW